MIFLNDNDYEVTVSWTKYLPIVNNLLSSYELFLFLENSERDC